MPNKEAIEAIYELSQAKARYAAPWTAGTGPGSPT